MKGRTKGRPRDPAVHQRILDAAAEELLRVGGDAVSLEAVAARAGVAKTTLYRRWPDRRALLSELGGWLPVPAEVWTGSPREKLEAHVLGLVEALRSPSAELFRRAPFDGDKRREWWMRERFRLRKTLADFELTDPEVTVDLLLGGVLAGFLLGAEAPDETRVKALIDQALATGNHPGVA